MPLHKIRIVQHARVRREIEIEVEGEEGFEGLTLAMQRAANGEVDAPAFGDPRWVAYWDLLSEEVSNETIVDL